MKISEISSWLVLSCVALALSAPASHAQDDKSIDIFNDKAKSASIFSFDYGVPTSPAMALAGLSPDKTTVSTSLKPFVLSLPSLFGNGAADSSAAFDTSLAWLLGGGDYAPDRAYADSYAMRFGYRTRLGMALFRGDDGGGDASKSKPSRAAIGLSVSLLDTSDPVMATDSPWRSAGRGKASEWDTCLAKAGDQLAPFLDSVDNKKQVISRYLSELTGELGLIGGDKEDPDYEVKLQKITPERLASIEAYLMQAVGQGFAVPASDAKITRGRLRSDRIAAENYEKTQSKDEVTHNQEALKVIQDCQKTGSTAAQHSADLEFGLGVVMSGDGGKWANFRNPNVSVWIAGRFPLNFGIRSPDDCGDKDKRAMFERAISCWMLGGSGRYSAGEMDATGDKTVPQFKANVAEGWVGLERLDSNSKFGGYYGYMDQAAANASGKTFAKSGSRYLFTMAYSLDFLYDGLWIQGSYGSAEGSVTTLDDKVALLSLSLGPPKLGSGFTSP